MNAAERRRLARAEAGIVARGAHLHDSAPLPDLEAVVAEMTAADRAAWDAITARYGEATEDPRFPLVPDDVEARVEVLARTMARLGMPVNRVWRYGWPVRYRSDWRNYRAGGRLGTLAGYEVLNGPMGPRDASADPDADQDRPPITGPDYEHREDR